MEYYIFENFHRKKVELPKKQKISKENEVIFEMKIKDFKRILKETTRK
jgi:hypothetical protein